MSKKKPSLFEQVLTKTEPKIKKDKIEELEQLVKVPEKETKDNMPKFQVFKDGYFQQADLLYLPSASFGKKYLLVVVETHSKKCDAEPLKEKNSIAVRRALEKIYEREILKKPKMLGVDSGSEFRNEFKTYCNDNDIILKVAHVGRHRQNAIAEAANKKIGTTIIKLLTLKEEETGKLSKDWTKYLKPIIETINENLPKPINEEISESPIITKQNKELLPVGTLVRVALDEPRDITGKKQGSTFRGGDVRYSRTLHTIENFVLKPGFPILYYIKGEHNIARTAQQLQVVKAEFV